MTDKALAFKLKGNYACFRDYSETGKLITTTQIPSPIQFYGMLGAILGLKGFGDVSDKNKWDLDLEETKLPEFYSKLQGLEYSILQNKKSFDTYFETVNNSTALYFTKGESFQLIQEFLTDVEFVILVKYSKELEEEYNQLKQKLEKQEMTYNVYLGKPELFASIDFIGEVNLQEESNSEVKLDCWLEESKINGISENEEDLFDDNLEESFLNKTSYFSELEEISLIKKSKRTAVFTNQTIENYMGNCYDVNILEERRKIAFMKI